MTDINKNKYASLLLLTAMIFMGPGFISKAEAGLPVPPTETLSIPIGNGSDDAEESVSNGSMSLTSSDLELTQDGTKQQKAGLRFVLDIPAGATILNATIQFTVDETGSDPTSLTIHGQDTNNAPTFSSSTFDISQRALTLENISWAPSAWPTKGEAGPNQQTPDLSAIVQASVDQSGWMQGNAIAFIISGSGKRVAESFSGTAAPVLQVEFSLDSSPPLTSDLRITEVAVETDSLTITGEAFGFSDILDLKVTLGDSSTGMGPGDITPECTSGTPPTATSIICDLSAVGGLPEAGDYLLTVSTGADQSQNDEYSLTIGAVGPAGADGTNGVDANQAQLDALQAQVDILQALVDELHPSIVYEIGDEGPAGGIVFHVTNGGLNGLEAAPVDQSSAQWCSSSIDIANVGSHSAGAHNTPLIVAACGSNSAASVATNYAWPNGQTDGFLPNKAELSLLYVQRNVVGSFASTSYWSSSEHNASDAWYMLFSVGIQPTINKGNSLGVRAVRGF